MIWNVLQELDKNVAAHRVRRKAALDQARAVREKIAVRMGGILPDSADELGELREERADEPLLCVIEQRHALK